MKAAAIFSLLLFHSAGWIGRSVGTPFKGKTVRAYWGFFEDHVGVKLRHEIGVDRMMWSTDFPHVVTRWPRSLEMLHSQMAGIPEDERWQMAAGNAIKFFRLNRE